MARFLSVFLAPSEVTAWFLNLGSVLYLPPPAPPAALPSPHPQLTHTLSPSHPSPALPSLPQPSYSPPTAAALEQLRPENEWVLPSHALLSDRDPCSAVYVASFLGPRGGTARFLNVFGLTSRHGFLMSAFLNALT